MIRKLYPLPVLVAILIALSLVQHIEAAQERVIEAFDYLDNGTAQRVWINGEGTPAVKAVVHENRRGVRISTPSSKELKRTVHDLDLNQLGLWKRSPINLSRYGYFTLDLFVENPDALDSLTLYFRSKSGWYGASLPLEQNGWQRLVFNKAGFRPEGAPSWGAITGIRLSVWPTTTVKSSVIVDQLAALSHHTVIMMPTGTKGASTGDIQAVRTAARVLTKMLKEVGISADTLDDTVISTDTLKERRLVILPSNPKIPDTVADTLRRFVEGGGKLFVTYNLAEDIADLLHLRPTDWVRQDFASIQLHAPELVGLPKSVKQASWNITVAEPTDNRTRAVGYWHDVNESRTKYPALFLGDNGAFLSHIVLSDDWRAKRQLFAALFGHLDSDYWADIAAKSLDNMGSVGHLKNFEATAEFIKKAKSRRALKGLKDAEKLMFQAQTQYRRKNFAVAANTATKARSALSEAYLWAHSSPKRQGRAVWNHSGTGAYPGDWDRSARELAKAGFNMIIPNMLWGGLAHYPSNVLPRSEIFDQYGDQVAQCVKAAHRHGLEVHVWKVNWNLHGAPDTFVAKMREAGRTQVSRTGKPINWLCPSHPENVKLELNSLLEIAQNYDVDGIHFDYIRYPGPEACYCENCRTRFTLATRKKTENWPDDVLKAGALKETYLDWRVEQISRLVRLAHKRLRTLRPDLKLSAAVFSDYPPCVKHVGQDWVAWAEAGYIDFLCPMIYTDDDSRFAHLVKRQLELSQKRIPIYPGIGATTSRVALTPDRVVGQIHIARQAGGAGFAIFDYSSDTAGEIIPAIGASATSTRARPVHN
jgi:uncharacterized lipoprotein YddW (UPF0748 family)